MRKKVRTVVWEAQQWPSMEYLRLEERAGEIAADGTIVMIDDDLPLRIRYIIRCDPWWAVRQISIQAEGHAGTRQRLSGTGSGKWSRTPGHPLTALDGCIDVDIAATPFTNTLPIRRLGLKPGESAEIKVVYFSIPELSFRAARQRYTCLEARLDGWRYRYEGLESGFAAELQVDADGLVIDYQGLWKRRWPR